MTFNLVKAPIAYGEANTASFKDSGEELYYQAGRIKNRILLDFGEVTKDQRTGIRLSDNGINTACLLHSIHAPAGNSTDDSLVWEVHSNLSSGVADRFLLQYIDKREAPFAHPEFILLPEYVVYVIPGQTSRVVMVLEPINLITHATNLV